MIRPRSVRRQTAPPQRRLHRVLAASWWAGVSGLAALIAIAIAVPPLLHKDKQPSDGGTTTPAALSSDSLHVAQTWPTMSGCDGATEVAVLRDGPEAESVRLNPSVDVRELLTGQGAASFGSGHLYVSLSADERATVQILSIRPLFFASREADVAWVYDPQGGCGGEDVERVISLDLEHRRYTDRGTLSNETPATPEAGSPARSEPFGPAFVVEAGRPALVRVDAEACTGYYEWGLQIKYQVGGKIYTQDLGSPSKPYRSVGSLSEAKPGYSIEMNPEQSLRAIEPIQRPIGCPATAGER